ncbi:uncharacterized protein [Dysidea avara]
MEGNVHNRVERARALEEMLADEERVAVEVYTGAYRWPNATRRNVVTADNINLIEAEHLVALNVFNCDQHLLGCRTNDIRRLPGQAGRFASENEQERTE